MLLNLQVELADMAEVTEDETHDQRSACSSEAEGRTSGKRDRDASENESYHNSKSESSASELIKCEQLGGYGLLTVEITYRCKERFLMIHVCLKKSRNDLYKQNYSDNAERISYSMTYCNLAVELGTFKSALSRSESRCTCKGSGHKTYCHGRSHIGNKYCNESCNKASRCNDEKSEKNIGLGILLEVLEERRTCNKTYRSNEQDKTDILDDLKRQMDTGSDADWYIGNVCRNAVYVESL